MLVCVVVERQWTSNVVQEKAMSSHLLLAHVEKFVIVSTVAFHDLDKALCDKNTFFSLSWPIALKKTHDGFDQLIDVVWRLLELKRLDRSEESEIEKKLFELNHTV
jgi:hypothetical protein